MIPLPSSPILSFADVQSLQVQLDVVDFWDKSYSTNTQTMVWAKEWEKLYLLTTNNFPLLHAQVLDRLKAQDYQYQIWYTDDESFAYALTRYDQHDQQVTALDAKRRHEHSVRGREAIALLKETFNRRDTYTGEHEFLNDMIRLSFQAGSSDLHFQAEEVGMVLRLRRDGILETVCIFTHAEFVKYMMKIKFDAGMKMNIDTESQDGRMDFHTDLSDKKIKIDIRVSVMPGLRGESIVMRFLDSSKGLLTLDQIGMQPFQQMLINKYLHKNHGLILVCGPTGSGKTTTVYSLMNMINHPSKKIITLEDPVEYELPGIEQSQINEKKGYTFEAGLKWVLRHDPDIIMVGEIRTLGWAEMAINAALTGHLVISTLHTNSALEAIARLLNMGVKPYMLASSLSLVIGQRLARRISTTQRTLADASTKHYIDDLIAQLPETQRADLVRDGTIPHIESDDEYAGRISLQEIVEVTDTLKHDIIDEAPLDTLLATAIQDGFVSMEQDSLMKVLQGKTTLEEIARVL
jgi:type II secretory ATPase GspE/PulE/Tfp pilus assembly ATPase PilB-like protein